VQEWSDVTNELPQAVRRELVSRAQQQLLPDVAATTPGVETPLQVLCQRLLKHLQPDVPQQLDSLLESFDGTSSSELIGALFDLEMSGLIRQLPGKKFVKVW
jgi:DNA processing protein